MKIICLHYAGGNGYFYYQWKNWLPGCDIVPLDLPGHGRRIQENLLYDFKDALEYLFNEVVKAVEENEPYVIFGHSMGGLFVLYILDRLEMDGKTMPQGVILSGASVPVDEPDHKRISEMNDDEFLQMILDSGGTNIELIKSLEFKNCFFPIIKADYIMLDKKHPLQRNRKFQVKAAIFNGLADTSAIRDEKRLKEYFNEEVTVHHFEGGHFYFESKKQLICNSIRNFVENVLGGGY
ncbi:external thioesterase TEII [Ruminiclostridium sufflavum DSM 19573]|uniref:External thioesterase TEII n=1 Tax=Ruminiclostridium sufflavum DSM 19573 TaxID=1121337 RepID=A0A318XQE7_9FIRM|nr:alpha/beta fold hydrolase [Ruminiclostridium sufflavum]PYG88039.1 external thioesterase TEII [Ruminiclostridium sufflavum DSM 19573]